MCSRILQKYVKENYAYIIRFKLQIVKVALDGQMFSYKRM